MQKYSNAFNIFTFIVLTFSMIFKHRYFMQHTCVYSLGEYLFFFFNVFCGISQVSQLPSSLLLFVKYMLLLENDGLCLGFLSHAKQEHLKFVVT